jgi:hypothetical protein
MRIKKNNAYIYFMKARLNITIDDNLLSSMKAYATKRNTSVSELVTGYFKNVTKQSSKRKSIIDLVEKLEPPAIDKKINLKDSFHQSQAKKYGF